MVEAAVASSTGIEASYRRSSCFLSASAIAGEGADTQTGAGYTVGRGPDDLDPAKAAADAIERSTRLLGAKKPPSGRTPVVLDGRVTSSLLAILAGTLNGESVLKGRSLFTGRLAETVASPLLTLVDDPTNPDAYGASVYDGEGLACRRNILIEDGVLQQFVYNTYAARRAGVGSTGSAVRGGFKGTPGVGCRAVIASPGQLDQAAIMRAVGDGLLVQGVTGIHSGVNSISGDFSVGAEGLLFRNGELAGPVREFTIASTLQRMLLEVTHVGNDLEWLPSSAAGVTLAIAEMSMSGA
jgi:PmbA protein